jgi:hypothetical protein
MRIQPDPHEVGLCVEWLWHRMAAKGLLAYDEAALVADEWVGNPPPGAVEAIARGDDDLTAWCPVLNPELVAEVGL